MKRDSRLSGVLHVLLHMAEQEGPVTSEVLARAMGTHAVVIRRIMAGLREAGYVRSEKGHGGGWRLDCDLGAVTLADVFAALGPAAAGHGAAGHDAPGDAASGHAGRGHAASGHPSLLAIGNRTEAPGCLVEQAVNAALTEAFDEAEALLLKRLGQVTLAALAADFHARLAARGGPHEMETAHAP